jgi:hypothetical protein
MGRLSDVDGTSGLHLSDVKTSHSDVRYTRPDVGLHLSDVGTSHSDVSCTRPDVSWRRPDVPWYHVTSHQRPDVDGLDVKGRQGTSRDVKGRQGTSGRFPDVSDVGFQRLSRRLDVCYKRLGGRLDVGKTLLPSLALHYAFFNKFKLWYIS